ncbi:MAG: efflux RND transporter periplasmic adaptor subunit [Planctomycetes bacterium]|nr:efflux RND transporter periplasmic adaptor subunit [Planctomycetota bacterium]
MKKLVAVLLVALLAAGWWWWSAREAAAQAAPSLRTTEVVRGTVVETVSTTGTLQAVTTVEVGTQVTGVLQEILVDFNSRVRKGEVIARLDPDVLEARLAQEEASLLAAQATVERARVAVEEARAREARTARLFQQRLAREEEVEAAGFAVRSAEASLRVEETRVTQAESAVRMARTNLEYATITSPIDGVVLTRAVDVGQTVAASLQAPVLFTIAEDLRQMRVEAAVDEADIGRIHSGQRVTFSVDAYPERRFSGRVTQRRLGPTVTQNVVTYQVIVETRNDDELLLPGMTANVSVEVARADEALVVPAAALRVQPPGADADDAPRGPRRRRSRPARAARGGLAADRARGSWRRATRRRAACVAAARPGRVWDRGRGRAGRGARRAGARRPERRGPGRRDADRGRRAAARGRARARGGGRRRRPRRAAREPHAPAAGRPLMGAPLIELIGVRKVYGEGESAVEALRGVDLRIDVGEAVAITGSSGSGKSTLMNLLGCLDHPTSGVCRIAGRDVGALSADQRADLRNRTIGFVFQGFHLLARTTAVENVELPLIYEGRTSSGERRRRAQGVLERVGLGNRLDHTSQQLSGGQQQRVAIARALVTEPRLILADEPTGNLDTKTTQEVLDMLLGLNAEGITVIVVTHEPEVAERFPRRIEVRDGLVVVDTAARPEAAATDGPAAAPVDIRRGWAAPLATLPVAMRAIRRHALRSMLTALGIVIGVGAVVGMLSIGRGARAAMQQQVATLGTNMVSVRSGSAGRGGVRWGAGSTNSLTLEDAAAIGRECPSIARVSPQVSRAFQIKAGASNWSALVEGVNEEYLEIRNMRLVAGEPFKAAEVRQGAKVCILGKTVVRELFGSGDPLDEVIRIDRVPFRVIGVLAERGESQWGQDQDDVVLAPLPVVQRRLMGITHVTQIYASAVSEEAVRTAEAEVNALLRVRHRIGPGQEDDFVVRTQIDMANFAGGMLQTMTMLLAAIAGVSLVVGGIGIMNIMLVSVTERTREIGIRLAIGARGRDVLLQFLVEAVALSAGGGALGVLIGAGMDRAVGVVAGWPSGLGVDAVALALGFSVFVGVTFGMYPARVAARLDPIVALRHE